MCPEKEFKPDELPKVFNGKTVDEIKEKVNHCFVQCFECYLSSWHMTFIVYLGAATSSHRPQVEREESVEWSTATRPTETEVLA